MALTKKLIVTTLFAFAALATSAQALDLQAGGQPKLKATKVQFGIISPENNVCPGDAKRQVWVFSNKPGTIPVLIVRKDGGIEGPIQVETKKGANGLSMGTFSDDFSIINPIDAEYRVVVPNSEIASNWVPLKASC